MLTIDNVSKSFDAQLVLDQIDLTIEAGEIVVLLGPSGCGKTTLLRLIAGLETPDNGRILLREQNITDLPVHERGFGLVFQEYALFPHKNVFDNVAFGLRMQQWSRSQIEERVAEVLSLVGLADFGDRSIHDLSGGEQQRVALARSLAPAPRLLLLDEPLGALDRALRERLMLELRTILKEAGELLQRPEGITAVYVTHDQAEAFAIADRVVVMNEGRIEQRGSPGRLYRQPRTPFVARFLGMENVLTGEIVSVEPPVVQTGLGQLTEIKTNGHSWTPGRSVSLLVRPEAAQLIDADETEEGEANVIDGRLQTISFRGRYQIATVCAPAEPEPITLKLEFETAVKLPPPDTAVHLRLDPGAIVLLESG